jgi:hypothetical protein
MMSLPVFFLAALPIVNTEKKGTSTFEQYHRTLHPVHLSRSLPATLSVALDATKQPEHALSSSALSRTESRGSTRTISDPAGMASVARSPRPAPAGDDSATATFVPDSLVAVDAVTAADDVMAGGVGGLLSGKKSQKGHKNADPKICPCERDA